MTFSEVELADIIGAEYNDDEKFLDEECFKDCYIYPLCPTCYGANYLACKTFKERDKRRCHIQKLIALFSADLHAKRIVKNPGLYSKDVLYNTIEAIKKIRKIYLPKFKDFFV